MLMKIFYWNSYDPETSEYLGGGCVSASDEHQAIVTLSRTWDPNRLYTIDGRADL